MVLQSPDVLDLRSRWAEARRLLQSAQWATRRVDGGLCRHARKDDNLQLPEGSSCDAADSVEGPSSTR
jgi:predicted 2-oxoglutarate/Fe(II)-dependent dioxygenase YbiX